MSNAQEMYKDIELTTEVMNASNHRQIQMLMERCLKQIRAAKKYINEKDMKKKHRAISNAADIISYLRSCLNFNVKEALELSQLLDSIYDHLAKSLVAASLKNDVNYLESADKALSDIKEGWDGIAQEV